jgi:hypothetical protein
MASKTMVALAAAVAVLTAGAIAVAVASEWGDGDRKGKRGGHGRGGNTSYLIQYDTDKNGTITRAEVDAALETQFKGADKNADGTLDAAEFHAYNDARKAERKARIEAWRAKREAEGRDVKERPPHDRGPKSFDPMKNMDWNRDALISPDEFAGRTRAQIMRADRDGDGNVLVADLQKKKHRHGRRSEGSGASAATAPAPQ